MRIWRVQIVAPEGIEPPSKVPETFVLSIKLRSQKANARSHCGCKSKGGSVFSGHTPSSNRLENFRYGAIGLTRQQSSNSAPTAALGYISRAGLQVPPWGVLNCGH